MPTRNHPLLHPLDENRGLPERERLSRHEVPGPLTHGAGSAASEAQREPQVNSAISDLRKQIAEAEALAGELFQQLSKSILRPDVLNAAPQAQGPKSPDADRARAPLADVLTDCAVRLCGINHLLRSISFRLEV